MNRTTLRGVFELVSRLGLNPSLKSTDVPDTRLVQLVEGPDRGEPGRALDLGCGAGRNTLYLARHGWEVIGIDFIGRAVDIARSKAVGAAAKARFVRGDVSRLEDLDIGDGYDLLNDSGCYYLLSDDQREGFAAGVTRVAAPGAILLMSGFTKLPGRVGISADDLRHRFSGWRLPVDEAVPITEIERHTKIPPPMKLAMKHGRLGIRRYELTHTGPAG